MPAITQSAHQIGECKCLLTTICRLQIEAARKFPTNWFWDAPKNYDFSFSKTKMHRLTILLLTKVANALTDPALLLRKFAPSKMSRQFSTWFN